MKKCKSLVQIKFEYLNTQSDQFSGWYSKLSREEKLKFNTVLHEMRNKTFENTEDDTKES